MPCQWCCHPVAGATAANNKGVLSLLAGDFQEAIHIYHGALEHSRQLVIAEGTNTKLNLLPQEDQVHCSKCQTPPTTSACHTVLSGYTPTAEANGGVQLFYEPLPIEESSWIAENLNQEVTRNLVVATVILNTAMAYHLISFSQDNAEKVLPLGNSAPMECRKRARGLYEKALQVLMALDVHQNEIIGTQSAVYDLVLMVILNNVLAMKDVTANDPKAPLYAQHLLMYAMDCELKNYGKSEVATTVSKWQGEFMANAMVWQFCEFLPAGAA